MYLRILKKDLKRKRAMNVILLIFIILTTMFVTSSVNNIISVTMALDNYLDMANSPDYLVMTINKSLNIDVEEIIRNASSIKNCGTEKVIFMSPDNLIVKEGSKKVPSGTNMFQCDSDLSINYFLSDETILKAVKPGEIYVSDNAAETIGLEIGDKITVEIKGISREFTFAGTVKDAVLGSKMAGMHRYIISSDDFESYISNETIKNLYGGDLYYIHTDDLDKTVSEISEASDSFIFTGDTAFLKFSYVFDMIVTGVLLLVSVLLIAIAFVVLRFTITFTLSEEYREIGVMKAIGISNLKIRGLYLVKYAALSVIGAVIGLVLGFPFGEMLMSISAKSIIINNQNPVFVNIICALFVIAVILLFCYGCTGKVKKMTPIDAIRNGQTGERFRKKSLMRLGKSKLPPTSFLALNDIVSSPKRFAIVTFTFFLCFSIMLTLSTIVFTMKSGTLIHAFGFAKYDVSLSEGRFMEYLVEGGHEKIKDDLAEVEETLAKNGMPASCFMEISFVISVSHGENKSNIAVNQGVGTTMDMYEYIKGTAPQNKNEIAITRISANKLHTDIGDTVTLKTTDGDREYVITAIFQTMYNQGDGIRLHTDEEINYIQAQGGSAVQILFTDNPDEEEIQRRIDKIMKLYPESGEIKTCKQVVSDTIGVTDALNAIKQLITILTIVLAALITVLMERSFISKEQGEIALMKAIGIRDGKIIACHTLRFVFVGIIAVVTGEIFTLPITHLFDPIFKMMGMELGVDYLTNSIEMYLIFPLVIMITTAVSAFLTSLYTRKIKSSDTANIE